MRRGVKSFESDIIRDDYTRSLMQPDKDWRVVNEETSTREKGTKVIRIWKSAFDMGGCAGMEMRI